MPKGANISQKKAKMDTEINAKWPKGANGEPKGMKKGEKRHAKNEAEKKRKNGCQKVWPGGMRVATPKCHYGTSRPYEAHLDRF